MPTTDQLAEAIQRLAALAQQPTQPQSSVELSQSAKGATQVTVKAYAASADVDMDAQGAQHVAQSIGVQWQR